jgi:hypothetical protein
MAARKSKQPDAISAEARAFTIVLEDIRAQNKAFGEGQELLREGQDQLREGQEQLREGQGQLRESHERLREELRAGFAEVDRRFGEVDRRFEKVDRRFEQMDRRFDRIEQDVGLVKIAVLDHSRELKETRAALANKVDRHEVETLVARGVR